MFFLKKLKTIIMTRFVKMANYASKQAEQSTLKYQHGAILTKGSKILATGYNKSRSKFLNTIQTCTHAEMDVILNYFNSIGIKQNIKKNHKLSKCILWVVRLSRDGKLTDSKPCCICLNYLKNIGIKKIGYSNSNGDIIISKTQYIHNDHVSYAQTCYNPKY